MITLFTRVSGEPGPGHGVADLRKVVDGLG
jgi:hypothetical protein